MDNGSILDIDIVELIDKAIEKKRNDLSEMEQIHKDSLAKVITYSLLVLNAQSLQLDSSEDKELWAEVDQLKNAKERIQILTMEIESLCKLRCDDEKQLLKFKKMIVEPLEQYLI